ncbi:NOL1/NOP2/sun family putative RNA methylase [Nanoarchaeota archaeon]
MEITKDKMKPKLMPNHEELEDYFKPAFIERYEKLTNFEEFKKFSLSFLRRSIRINTIKADPKDVIQRLEKQGWIFTKIPWCNIGYWIDHIEGRRDIGSTKEHTLGYFYVQEAASMIPPLVLDPKPDETILDMAAAPGSKTTQIASMMKNKGILLANDYKGARLAPLGINIQRCGITNIVLTLMDGHYFSQSNIQFDKVLVDAPCSGTGTIRKSLKTLNIWNPKMIRRLSATQKKLLKTAFTITKPGGTIVYSTCSCEPDENEAVVSWLLDQFDNAKIEKIDLELNRSPPIMEFEGQKYNPQVKNCLRLWPQDNDTEGFFVTKISKKR